LHKTIILQIGYPHKSPKCITDDRLYKPIRRRARRLDAETRNSATVPVLQRKRASAVITPLKVIHGYQFRYQSKACTPLPIITSHLAPSPSYRAVLIKFSFSTRG